MPLKRLGGLFLVGIAGLATAIGLLAFPSSTGPAIRQVLMACALYSYMFLVLAALTLPFLKELVTAFGKPFLSIHHTFAALGLAFITLHPVLYAVESSSASVFVPSLSSWLLFWAFGGQVALPLLYVAAAAALLRRKAVTKWRPLHMLIYAALAFGIVHANLLGQSFYGSIGIVAIYDALFAASMGVFIFKRYQNYQLRKRLRKNMSEKAGSQPTRPR